jgi:hypothetical protein
MKEIKPQGSLSAYKFQSQRNALVGANVKHMDVFSSNSSAFYWFFNWYD